MRWRIVPFAAATILFLVCAVLYLDGSAAYPMLIRAWGVDVFPTPFLDTDTVMSALRCRERGVDVFVANPCDPLRRVYDYSPLWLVLAHVPGFGDHVVAAGLAVDAAFLLSLLLMPIGRTPGEVAIVALGAVSTTVMFALERGNNDLVIFTLAVAGAVLTTRSRIARLLGYGALLLAGLLKYYPMAAMATALRERPRFFWTLTVASVAVVGVFLVVDGRDLVRALALIPHGSFYGSMFGSSTLAGGLAERWNWSPGTAVMLRWAMVSAALVAGAAWGSMATTRDAVERLSPAQASFLLVGGLLVLGCFFTAQNIGYRAIHVLLVLPALAALRAQAKTRDALAIAPVAALLLLWADGLRHGVAVAVGEPGASVTGDAALFSAWVAREVLWFYLVTILVGLIVAVIRPSPMIRWLLRSDTAAAS